MKRYLLCILILVVVTFVMLTASQYVLADDTYTVTFKLPEGHHYYTDGENAQLVDSLSIEVPKDYVLTSEDVEPYTHHCRKLNGQELDPHRSCRVTLEGWMLNGEAVNPVGMVITGDVTFTAKMHESHNVTVRMSKGYYTYAANGTHFVDPSLSNYSEFTMPMDDGYTITQEDVDIFGDVYPLDDFELYTITGFDKDPLGVVVNEDMEFTAIAKKLCHLRYFLPVSDSDSWQGYLNGCDLIKTEGESVTLDELMVITDDMYDSGIVAYAYWDVKEEDLQNIQDDIDIYAFFGYYGDVNGDTEINTLDAVALLKKSARMITLNNNQIAAGDCSHDGNVNTADAVLILKYAAGVITSF